MFVLSIITLIIASVSAWISLNTEEEIVKVSLGCSAVLFLLLTLFVAPWVIKLALVAIPLSWSRINNMSIEKTIN